VDISAPKVITLYKVDLNLGEEFNKEYMSKSLEKIKAAIAEYNATVEATKEEIKGYDDFISANDAEIAELKSTIRSLQDLSDSYKDVARNLKAKNKAAEMAMIKTVEDLITKKNF
jgi:predicted  nucleic acid-binding Zn-ribbon protein